MSKRSMTHEEVVAMVRAKEDGLNYIVDTFGIWSMPFQTESVSLKYWRDVLTGRIPRPVVNVNPSCMCHPGTSSDCPIHGLVDLTEERRQP